MKESWAPPIFMLKMEGFASFYHFYMAIVFLLKCEDSKYLVYLYLYWIKIKPPCISQRTQINLCGTPILNVKLIIID